MIAPLPNEAELVKQSARGNADAFGKLVSHYQDTVYNLVYRMMGHREDAMDITQEVFLRAFRNISGFEGRSRFITWLHSIAVNQAISGRRKQSAAGRAGQLQMSAIANEESAYDPPGAVCEPGQRLQADDVRRRIEQAIAELPDEYRAVVVLRDIQEMDYESIGEALSCSRGTVKSRLHRARLELRKKLRGLLADK